ncbi:putrescine transport system permease protein [Parvibaculum indicum]|uniref:ABC transporter permease subunit n=1 Tax=Parvibaculum indicum TaxID=562969 RepID=UPI0031B58C32|nr:putrescine transport system permease protein [Parvibaculum indicum]
MSDTNAPPDANGLRLIRFFQLNGRRMTLAARKLGVTGRSLVIGIPFAWLLLFFVVPFVIVLKISFATQIIGIPPYTDLMDWSGGGWWPTFNIDTYNYEFLLSDSLYTVAYLTSLKIAVVSTFLCLLVAYPMAYGIARTSPRYRNIFLLLIILPFWTSFLLRVYSWMGILKYNGLLNNFLIWTGIISDPLPMLHNDFSVYLGIVYSYLPFMLLPLYANLERMDKSLLEAAADLGASKTRAFFTVTVPLSIPGVIAGSLLVFIPAVGEFVIPSLLGGTSTLMIGRVLWDEFFQNTAWPVASAVAIVMLLILVVPIMVFQRFQMRED